MPDACNRLEANFYSAELFVCNVLHLLSVHVCVRVLVGVDLDVTDLLVWALPGPVVVVEGAVSSSQLLDVIVVWPPVNSDRRVRFSVFKPVV